MLWRGQVERLGWGGVGLGRLTDSRLVILTAPLAIFPGEEVEAELTEYPRHCEGAVLRWLRRDVRRVEPACGYAQHCGGCGLWGSAGWAGELKRSMVADLFARQLRAFPQYCLLDNWHWLPAPETALRSRIQLHWDGRALGFMRRGSNSVEAVDNCVMAEPVLGSAIPSLDLWLHGQSVPAGRWELATGTPPGDVVLTCDALPGEAWRLLDGRWHADSGTLMHLLGSERLQQSPGTFFQASPPWAWEAFSHIFSQWPIGGGTLYDLYGGGGFFSAMLRDSFAQFKLIESNPASIADARVNLAGMDAQVVEADSTEFLRSELSAQGEPAVDSIAILDPPRQGLTYKLCDALEHWRPAKLVLIGCDGANFCRDATRLSQSWDLTRLAAIDLFPNTAHVECVGLFEPG